MYSLLLVWCSFVMRVITEVLSLCGPTTFKKRINDLTSYQAGSTSWRRGYEVVHLVGVAGLWLEGRWRSTDGPLCHTTASPVKMCEDRQPLSTSIHIHMNHIPSLSDTHRKLSRQYQRKVSEGPGAGRGHHWYRGTVHLKGTGACWYRERKFSGIREINPNIWY